MNIISLYPKIDDFFHFLCSIFRQFAQLHLVCRFLYVLVVSIDREVDLTEE